MNVIPWRVWSDWAWRAKAELDQDEYQQLAREALHTEMVRIRPRDKAWAIESGGLRLFQALSFEACRRQAVRMGWRWER